MIRFVSRSSALLAATLCFTMLATGAAYAAAAVARGPSEAVFVAEVVLLLVFGRLGGEAMQRLGQPPVVGQLLAGIVLGPSVFGVLLPGLHAMAFPPDHVQKSLIDGVGQLGVLLLLLLTGMETDIALIRKVGRAAASVSVTGVAVPFGLGLLLGLYGLPDWMLPEPSKRFVTALFLGTALSISSIKIVAMVVRDMNFMRRNLGQVIVASAIIDDSIGWIIVALTFGVAKSGGLNAGSIALSVLGTAGFLAASYLLGRRAVSLMIRWANDRLVSEFAVVTAILVLMGAMALATDAIGVNTVLGAFVAGVLVGESPILTRHIEDQLRGLVTALFAPIFFGLAGLGTDLGILGDPALVLATLALILVASLGKFGGAFLGGRIGGLTDRECLALALGMNARGSTEVIVASIGLSMGVLDGRLFSMIVTMAVTTTMIMPPTLRWALARLPMGREEQERLDREAFEDKDFVANLERLLLTADASPSGRLAARLVGLIGGGRGLPTTAIGIGEAEPADDIRAGAAVAERAAAGDDKPDPVEVAPKRIVDLAKPDPVVEEAAKGYDLAVFGIEPAEAPSGGFAPILFEAVRRLEGPRAVVVARGPHRRDPAGAPLRILVPVTGAETTRRAAEIAFALARPSGAPVTLLHVTEPEGHEPGDGRRNQSRRALADEILHDVETLARQSGLRVRSAVRISDTTDRAILQHARHGLQTLIVLGVTPRPSGAALFGNTARALLDSAELSLLFVAA